MLKEWMFLYTCATTRGIYLDILPDCSSFTCVRGLKRFISNRSTPKLVISDNGSRFVSSETQDYVASKGIKWKTNLAATAWWGGSFERILQNSQLLTCEEVLTDISEIQLGINNRPFTFLYE